MARVITKDKSLIGVTTVGEKGQIVIPADIRAAFKLAKATKIVVIAHQKGIVLMRPADLEHMAGRFNALRTLIKKSK